MSTSNTISFKKTSTDQTQWDAIVIGSGMGGMTCAAALAKTGLKVLVLEQHYVPGGFTHTFSRKGYTWDVGVHCLGEMQENRAVGKMIHWLSDGKVKMNSLGAIYDSFHFPGGFRFDLPDSPQKFRENLVAAFPDETAAIDEYIRVCKEAAFSFRLHFALQTMPKFIAQIAEALLPPSKKKYWSKTVKEVLDSLTKNDRLKTVLAGQWGYYGSIPSRASFCIHAITTKHFWNGGFYPIGGSKVIADHFLNAVIENGGEVLVRNSVEKVLIENEKAIGVQVQNGKQYFAKHVVSATGARSTVEKIIPETHKKRAWSQSIKELKQSPPHLCLNLGLKGDVEKFGATKSNQWFFETWDMEHEYWDLADPNSLAPVLYVSYPSLKDPLHDAGPEKRHTAEAVTFVPWDAFEKWQNSRRGFRSSDYQEFKKQIETRMLAQLKRHIPDLFPLIDYCELATPLSTTHFTRAPEGAIYGLEPTVGRFECKELRTRTPIQNFYMSGADVATLGVVGAMVGGVLTAGTIKPKLLKQLMSK